MCVEICDCFPQLRSSRSYIMKKLQIYEKQRKFAEISSSAFARVVEHVDLVLYCY